MRNAAVTPSNAGGRSSVTFAVRQSRAYRRQSRRVIVKFRSVIIKFTDAFVKINVKPSNACEKRQKRDFGQSGRFAPVETVIWTVGCEFDARCKEFDDFTANLTAHRPHLVRSRCI